MEGLIFLVVMSGVGVILLLVILSLIDDIKDAQKEIMRRLPK